MDIKNIDNAPQAKFLRFSWFCNEENYPFPGAAGENFCDYIIFDNGNRAAIFSFIPKDVSLGYSKQIIKEHGVGRGIVGT